jgi:hypothetical protein
MALTARRSAGHESRTVTISSGPVPGGAHVVLEVPF